MTTYKIENGSLITLRLAEENDANEIINFYKQVGKETTYLSFGENEYLVTIEQQISTIKEINTSKNNIMVLALVNSKIIGIGTISSSKRKKSEHVGILGIVVSQNYFNNGIGSRIIKYLIDWCKTNKITTKVSLSVRKDNLKAVALYEKFGFSIEGVLKNETLIDGKYFDILAMGLMLDTM
ncbi:GNAT family N-acetyltransferase [Cetobacterium somerae]|uniref:GNAT family N-acetyltransferase n=1 Tax=Cetobacterium somerae TaxID=188913 RepID=UPI00224D07DD|nr:GNAT family N-acetyltransferase [Cetobacterium somerae]MCX3066814.1 GNAT family N-acetyltransferase [Cetobacterium somerae]